MTPRQSCELFHPVIPVGTKAKLEPDEEKSSGVFLQNDRLTGGLSAQKDMELIVEAGYVVA